MHIYQKTRWKKILPHRLIPNIHVGVFSHSGSTKCVPGIMQNTLNILVHSAGWYKKNQNYYHWFNFAIEKLRSTLLNILVNITQQEN